MSKKNILIFMLCMTFLLNISSVFAVEKTTESGEYVVTHEEGFVKALGFAEKIPSGDKVSYIEWASVLLELQGVQADGMSDTEKVKSAIDSGYIYSTMTAVQRPGDFITLKEALYGGACVLGYGKVYDEERVMSIALTGGLRRGITLKENDYLARDAFFKLVSNICDASYMEVKGSGNGGVSTSSNNTILSEIHKIYSGKGRITANELTGLYSQAGAAGEESVKIDGVEYCSGLTEAQELIGREIKFWYKESKDDLTLLYVEVTDESKVINIEAKDIDADNTTKTKISWTLNSRTKYKSITSDAAVIYNGVAHPGYDRATFAPQSGTVQIIGDNIVVVWSYVDFWVSEHNTTENIVTSFYGEEITLDPYEKNIKIFDKDMNSKYVVDVRRLNVLSIAESADKTLKHIKLSDTKVSGKISAVKEEGGFTYITVDGKQYRVSQKYMNTTSRKKVNLTAGKSVAVYLDVFGVVCGAENMSGTTNVGYVLNARSNEDEETAWIKMYIPGGDVVLYQCADKVIFDKREKVAPHDIPKKFEDSNNEFGDGRNFKRQLIGFSLNKDGEISEIDMPSAGKTGESEDSLRCMYNYSTDGGKQQYRANSASVGGKFLVSGTTIIAATAKDSAPKDSDFRKTTIEDNKQHYVDAYCLSQSGLYADYIIVYPESAINPVSHRMILVSDIITAYDEATEEVCPRIRGVLLKQDSGGENPREGYLAVDTEYIDISNFNISEGDIIKCGLNSAGKVIEIEYMFDYSEKKIYNNNAVYNGYSTGGWNSEYRTMLSSVIARDGAGMEVRQGIEAVSSEPTEYLYIGNYGGIPVFDKERRVNKAYLGSASDVKAYEDNGEFSIIFNTTYWGEARQVAVYK